MERKTTKMLALVAVIGLCAVALIGAAYAAFAGSASTYNQGNAVDTGYMTLSPNGDANTAAKWAAISSAGKEAFSTYTYVVIDDSQNPATYTDKMAYYFAQGGAAGTGVAADYTVKQIGDAKSFTLENQTGESITYMQFKATAANGTNGNLTALNASDFKYFLKVTISGGSPIYLAIDGTEKTTDVTAVTFDQQTNKATITVAICVGYDANVYIPTSFIGPATQTVTVNPAIESANAPVDMVDIDFAFKAVAADAPQNP